MSTQYIAIIVNLLVMLLPLVGVTVESQAVETTIQTLTAVVTGLWVMYQRTTLEKSIGGRGDVTILGKRKL